MPSEFAIVLSDNIGFDRISAALSRRGMGVFHAPTLADLARIDAVCLADLLVVDGSADCGVRDIPVSLVQVHRRRRGIFVRSRNAWIPADQTEIGLLLGGRSSRPRTAYI